MTIGSGLDRSWGRLAWPGPALIFSNPLIVDAVTPNSGSGQDTYFVQGTAGVALLQVNAIGGNSTFLAGDISGKHEDVRIR